MDRIKVSKYISMVLRHKPEVIGVELNENGWLAVDKLIEGVSKRHVLNQELLEEIVAKDSKKRFAFNDDKTLIRANQGHSIDVDVELTIIEPPEILYHGTGEKYKVSIDKEGLKPRTRLHVHLSEDRETAIVVGTRHGNPIVYRVESKKMYKGGYVFYRSENGVWLTKEVPVRYLIEE